MRNLLLVAALLSLAACKSDYTERTRDSVTSAPAANPTGSAAYQTPGTDTGRQDYSAPANPTGSAGYQRSGVGADTVSGAPPRNPTGSVGYQQ